MKRQHTNSLLRRNIDLRRPNESVHAALPSSAPHPLPLSQPSAPPHPDPRSTISSILGPCAIALAARQGCGLEARVLRGKDPSCRWTHLGLAFALGRSGAWHVVHADPGHGHDGRVREDPFGYFAAQGLHAQLLPLPVVTADTATTIRNEALRHVGVPFDGSYDWTRHDAMYCTSFLWWIFTAAGIPAPQPPFPSFVLPMLGPRELILPSLFTRHTGDLWD